MIYDLYHINNNHNDFFNDTFHIISYNFCYRLLVSKIQLAMHDKGDMRVKPVTHKKNKKDIGRIPKLGRPTSQSIHIPCRITLYAVCRMHLLLVDFSADWLFFKV